MIRVPSVLLIFFLLALQWGMAQQIVIDDDFSDGNFTSNPAWNDPENKHTVNNSNQLQLDAPAVADTAVISTSSDAAFGTWDFWVHFGFNPSSTSFSRLYLVADTETMKSAVNGYFIRVGHTDDEVSLFRQDGDEETKIIDGTDDLLDASSVTVRIRVTRDLNGTWELLADPTGGQNFISQGSATDISHTTSTFVGIFSTYIGSRSALYFYDDIRVEKITPPLQIVSIDPINNATLEVRFNIPVDGSSLNTADFSVSNGIGNPSSLMQPDGRTVRLNFDPQIPGGNYSLSVSDISDTDGNSIPPGTSSSFFLFDAFEPGDVVINEFMADPPSGLPEYIELFNPSDKVFNLQNWVLADSNSEQLISTDTLMVPGKSFVVISPDTTLFNNVFGSRNYHLLTSMPALNNSGDNIVFKLPNGIQADSLTYTSAWGGNDVALERRSAVAPSTVIENWADSPSPEGGTPGAANLVSPDMEPPELTGLQFPNTTTLLLGFSERVTTASAENNTIYTLSGNRTVTNAIRFAPDSVRLSVNPAMSNNTEHTLAINGIEDIFGNATPSFDTTFTFFEISEADSGDVLLTEFMYDPPDGFTEYLELTNTSNKTIDLLNWSFNDAAGNPSRIAEGSFIMPPGGRVVIAPDRTLETLFPDITIIETGSRFSALNNGGDQIKIFRSDGTRMDSLTYSPEWGGQEVALERRSIQVPAVFRENWGDSPSPDLGTPGQENQVATDTQPPDITELKIISNQELLLRFSERVEGITGPSNFTFEPQVSVATVTIKRDSVLLSLSQPLVSGVQHTITINNLEDIFGNQPGESLQTSFTFFQTVAPQPGDLLVNEFMYDPPSGYSEYVEILNHSSNAIDLSGLKWNDNTGPPVTITSIQTIIPSGEQVVLLPDSTLISLFPDRPFVVAGSAFQTLNNGGDAIKLFSTDDTLIDSLTYLNTWGGDAVALERRAAEVPSFFRENWGDSPSPDFGTPGLPNAVEPDQTPPEVLSVQPINENRIQINVSERPDAQSATREANYIITPSRSIQMVFVNDNAIELLLLEPLVTNQEFSLEINNLADLFGNILSAQTFSFELFRFQNARPGDIVVNEILFQKAPGSDVEFVELFNRSDRDIDINLFEIGDASGRPASFSSPDQTGSIPLPAGEFVVLTNDTDFADSASNFVRVPGFPSLNDDEDAVFLRSSGGQTIDSLSYNSSWGGDENGFSLERIDPFGASNDPSNWRTSTAPSGSTPGRANSVLVADEMPPQPIFSTLKTDGFIEIRFNEFINPTNDLTFSLNGTPLQIEEFDENNGDIIILSATEINTEDDPGIEIQNLTDLRGNKNPQSNIPLSLPLGPGDVVFNEIMFDPITAKNPEDPSQSEYLELLNRTGHAVSLEGLRIFEQRLPDGSFDNELRLTNRTGLFIPSGGHFLVFADPETAFQNSRVNRFFGLDSLPISRRARVDATTLQLNNSGQPLILSDSTGNSIDSLVYSSNWHNPNLADTKGISLERKVPGGNSSDGRNWGSASTTTVPEGGTPGAINTISGTGNTPGRENSITIKPNPFSPNGDGKDDNLIITYSLSEVDFMLRVRIYDRYGREIRTLADGEPAGRSGTLVWDGLDDNGHRNRIGYYIIYFEALNSTTASSKIFKETVVLARQL